MRYFLLVPFLIEYVQPSLEYNLPGLPYTTGKLAFILYGIFGIISIGISKLDKMFLAPFFILTGFILGGFINGSIKTEMASVPYYISLTVIAFDLGKVKFRKWFGWAMGMIFSHSVIYIIANVFVNYEYNSYSLMVLEGGMIHPHVVGVHLTVSSIYLIVFLSSKNRKLIAYSVTVCAVGCIILLESRHNLIAFILSITAYFIYIDFKKGIKLIPIPIIIILIFINLTPSFERTKKRFDYKNTEYQSRTTESRFAVLKQFPTQFSKRMAGRGLKNIRVDYGNGFEMTPHNQYITVAFAGGILSITTLMFLIITTTKKILANLKNKYFIENELPIIFVLFNLMITLLFIEFWGLTWFLFLSILIYIKMRSLNFAVK